MATTKSTLSFSKTTRQDTGNTGYDAAFVDYDSDYTAWTLQMMQNTDYTYSITLDSVDYDIRLRWNTRDESWQVFIGPSGEDAVITFKATNGLDLLKPYKYLEGVPNGNLYFVDTVKINGRPDFYNSGTYARFQLIYIDAETDQD